MRHFDINRRSDTELRDARTRRGTMASQIGERFDVHAQLGPSLEERQEPGARELCDLIQRMLNGAVVSAAPTLDLKRLKNGVYRLRIGGDEPRAIVLKCLKPAIAQTDRLVMERWLPALGLTDRSPRLLAGAAGRDRSWAWQAYERIRAETVNSQRPPAPATPAVPLITDLATPP